MSSRFQRLELEGSNNRKNAAAPAKSGRPVDPAQESPSQLAPVDDLHDCAHWMRLADSARQRGQFEDALRNFSRAVEADRSHLPGWVGQVRMLIALEEFPEAEMWAKKALELFKDHPDLTAARAQALCRIGDVKQAQALCDAAIARPGQNYYPWIVRGEIMIVRRDPAEAHCFKLAVQLNGDWTTLADIAEVYLFYRNHAKALPRAQEALAKAPAEPHCWYLQGVCQLQSGMTDAGQKSLKHCLELQPNHPGAVEALQGVARGGWLKRFFSGS